MSAESGAVVALPALFQNLGPLEEQFIPTCLIKCDSDKIMTLREPVVHVGRKIALSPFQNLMSNLEMIHGVDDIKYHSFLFLGFSGDAIVESFYTTLVENECDLIGVSYTEPNACTAVCRRTACRRKFKLREYKIDHIFALRNIKGCSKQKTNAMILMLIEAWLQAGESIKVNFIIDKTAPLLTVADLKDEWAGLTKDEIEGIILLAEEKVKCKRPHTARESFISTMGRKVLAHLTSSSSVPACVKYVNHDDYIPVERFVGVSGIICRTFDVISGALVEFPVLEWVSGGHFREHTLVLHGDSNLGKTQLAMSMLALIAEEIFESAERSYFLKVETIEGLKEAASGYIKKGVAILFDDIEPSKVRGTRKGSTLEDLKNLTEVTTTSTLHARFKDIVIDENEPRCFTSNACDPSEWHDGLPADVFITSAAVRAGYPAGIKAVFKRTVFAHVRHSIISEEMRAGYTIKRRRPYGGASSSSIA